MKLTGAKKLQKQLRDLPDDVRAEVDKAIRRNTEAGARLARQLVPVDSGELKGWIFTKYDQQDGLRGSVEAAPPTKEAQIKARAVEFGRKFARTSEGTKTKNIAATGQTNEQPYMRIMQKHLGKRFRNSIRAAIRKAVRSSMNG
jgi:hypothetical protein